MWKFNRRRRGSVLLCTSFTFFLIIFNFWSSVFHSSVGSDTEEVDLLIYEAIGPRETPSAAYVFPNQETALHVPRSHCDVRNGTNVFILFMVISAPANTNARNIIRSGFKFFLKDIELPDETLQNKNSELLFFIGRPEDSLAQRRLINEATLHRDIIIEDLSESYLNLTLKSLRMLKWIKRHCDEADFIVKVDDDFHLNLRRLSGFLKPLSEISSGRNLIGGNRKIGDIPIRDPSSIYGKWYAPVALWPDSTYPDYVAGFFYVLGRDARRKVYEAALRRPLFHLEDVFLTGIVSSSLGLKVTDLPIIYNHWSPFYNFVTTSCDLKNSYMGIHFWGQSYLECWMSFNDKEFVCDTWPLFTKCWF